MKKLKSVLENLKLSQKGVLVDAFDSYLLIRKWPLIVGENLSQKTLPLKGQRKNLLILSSHAIYSQEVKFMEKAILQKIVSVLPKLRNKIHRMSFQTDEALFEEKKKQFSRVNQGPGAKETSLHPQSPEYKTYKKEACDISCNIEDKELRDLLISFYIKVKGEEKIGRPREQGR